MELPKLTKTPAAEIIVVAETAKVVAEIAKPPIIVKKEEVPKIEMFAIIEVTPPKDLTKITRHATI